MLVAASDAGFRDRLAGYLAEHGFLARTAADASVLDGALAGARPELLVLDLARPGEDGLFVCRWLSGAGGGRLS